MLENFHILGAAPVINVQLFLDGIFIGAIYALAGYGLALVWGVMNLKNLAQGDFVIMGGYIAFVLYKMGIHPLFGLPVAIVFMFGFGWMIYRTIIFRIIQGELFISLLATFGLAISLQQVMNLVFGSEVQTAESGFKIRTILGGLVTVADIKLLSFLITVILAAIITTFMKYSRMGQAIRATAQDPRAAKVLGIDTERIYAFTFALNAAICGAAGVLISMIWTIQPFYGLAHSIRAFVIVTAAGLGNLPGVIVAALGLGVVEQFGSFILGMQYQQGLVVSMLVLVLGIRQIQQMRQRQAVI